MKLVIFLIKREICGPLIRFFTIRNVFTAELLSRQRTHGLYTVPQGAESCIERPNLTLSRLLLDLKIPVSN